MLQTQFLSAGASGFYGPTGFGGYDLAAIKALQNALIKAGKGNGITANGVMDGYTAAAVYEIIRDQGGTFASALAQIAGSSSVASGITSAFKALQSMDSTLQGVPLISLSIPSLLRDADKVGWVVSMAPTVCRVYPSSCSTVNNIANTIQNALNTFFSKLSEAAPTLLKVIGILVPGSTTTAPTPTPTTAPTPTPTTPISPKAAMMAQMALIRPQYMTLSPQASPTAPSATPGATPGAMPGATPGIAKAKYPPGSIARLNVKRKVWSIYVPIGAKTGLGLFDVDGSCLYGDCGLGADEPPPGTTKGGEEPTPTDPGSGQPLPQDPKQEGIPLYKKPLFWIAVAGGAVAVGGGSYWLIHRRKRSA